ncbi:hypothetical protein Q428_10850 [Fervidicella metallireducens AeB]|uniref:SHOCT-like domain-containing protein n=1 Tax=Fervidicella metallireducens AeB TaxID=1403537 RepID=A0A017RVH9_9CLOT|nr:SHOCT domain-containing protein [Fervidicella metallireducens]EYE87915.1 hypothetical protein Q428_10850 [Fervidicella metallireducens AeB]
MQAKEITSVPYLISRSILKELLEDGLMTEEEFSKIDAENKKTFNK